LEASRTALFSFEGTNLASVRRFARSTAGELVFERPFLLFASVLAGVFKEIVTKIEERGAAAY
jgi:hypothetical protein